MFLRSIQKAIKEIQSTNHNTTRNLTKVTPKSKFKHPYLFGVQLTKSIKYLKA